MKIVSHIFNLNKNYIITNNVLKNQPQTLVENKLFLEKIF